MTPHLGRPSNPTIVKRYARSRLYDTARGCYVTVEDLRRWQSDGLPFNVREADTDEDITIAVLA